MILQQLALWLLLPWLSRLTTAWRQGARGIPWGATLLQDFAVAAQLCAILLGVAALPEPAGAWGAGILAATAYGLYTLDGVLFQVAGIRAEIALISYVRELPTLAPRAWPAIVVGWGLTVAGVAYVASRWFLRAPPPEAASLASIAIAALPLVWAAWRCLRRTPQALAQRWSNALFLLQAATLRRAEPETQGAAPWVPTNEIYIMKDPAFPLLRQTRQFTALRRVGLNTAGKPHIVLLQMESFRARDIGALGGLYPTSPCFDALAQEGVLWTRFYTHGSNTARALLSTLYGIMPPPSISMPHATASSPPPFIGIPHLLAEQGYRTGYFTNGPLRYEDTGDFVLANGFAEAHGGQDIRNVIRLIPGSDWGPFDEYLMRFHLRWLQEQHAAGVPTFSTLATITNHPPWDAPLDAPWPRQPGSWAEQKQQYFRYLRTFAYADRCLGNYVRQLREAGLEKEIILLVTADTGVQVDPQSNQLVYGAGLQDEAFHIPLLLWAPGRLEGPARIDSLAGQTDLLPTLVDAFGLQTPHHAAGTSLLRDTGDRAVHFSYSYEPGCWGLRQGDYRFLYSPTTQSCELYDLRQDPAEAHDIAAQHPELVRRYRQQVIEEQTRADELFTQRRWAPPRV